METIEVKINYHTNVGDAKLDHKRHEWNRKWVSNWV